MNADLKYFIDFLEDRDLMEFDIDGDSKQQFTNRLKLQKYVFLAKRFGMQFPYDYNIYLYGPYSSALATDYYDLARSDRQDSSHPSILPDEFKKNDFLKAIRNDREWLEIAATLIDRNECTRERTVLIEEVYRIKSRFGNKFITNVLNDLEKYRLVSFHD